MNEVTVENVKTFEDLKSQLNIELNQAAISFVRIGYLLKTARDTDILKDTEYNDVNDFAAKEFGLDRSQVSRFMRINDRFSISGYSEHLKVEYEGYGSAKLSLMLTLPEEINEELSPDMSKADIQAIKEELEEEQKITPLEHMSEDKTDVPDEFIMAVVKQLNDEHPEPAELMHELIEDIDREFDAEDGPIYANDVKESYMPDGDKIYIINVPGQGRYMIKCTDEQLMITSMANMEKSPISWEEFTTAILKDVSHRDYSPKKDKPQDKLQSKPKKVEKSKKPEKPKAEAQKDTEETEAAGTEEATTEAAGKPEEDTEQQAKIEEAKKDTEEERKLGRIASGLRALADQFDRGTGGNLYDNPIEELEGMINEINALPGELIPIIRDAIKRISAKEVEA